MYQHKLNNQDHIMMSYTMLDENVSNDLIFSLIDNLNYEIE